MMQIDLQYDNCALDGWESFGLSDDANPQYDRTPAGAYLSLYHLGIGPNVVNVGNR